MNQDANPTLCQLQSQELKLLDVFQRICEENRLTFYLTAGTLLGAVRHKGFIPWDDDIDIAMLRRDCERLRTASLPQGYQLQYPGNDFSHPWYFSKLRLLKSNVWIDIFPLDPCPKKEALARIFFKVMELLTVVLTKKCGYTKGYMQFLFRALRLLPDRCLFTLRERVRRFFGALSSGRKLCTVGGRHGYPRECYQAEWFRETEEKEFEGHMFPAPIGWDAVLRNLYGEYMIPVREEGHFDEVGME